MLSNPEIVAGFEARDVSPAQAQKIADLRALLVQAAIGARDLMGDGAWSVRAIKAIQTAFSYARTSVMVDPPQVP